MKLLTSVGQEDSYGTHITETCSKIKKACSHRVLCDRIFNE